MKKICVLCFVILIVLVFPLLAVEEFKYFTVEKGKIIVAYPEALDRLDGYGILIQPIYNPATNSYEIQILVKQACKIYLVVSSKVGVLAHVEKKTYSILPNTTFALEVPENNIRVLFTSYVNYTLLIDSVEIPKPAPPLAGINIIWWGITIFLSGLLVLFAIIIVKRPEVLHAGDLWKAIMIIVFIFGFATLSVIYAPEIFKWIFVLIGASLITTAVVLFGTAEVWVYETPDGDVPDLSKYTLGIRFFWQKPEKIGGKEIISIGFPARELMLTHGWFGKPFIRKFGYYVCIRGKPIKQEKIGFFKLRIVIEPYIPSHIMSYKIAMMRAMPSVIQRDNITAMYVNIPSNEKPRYYTTFTQVFEELEKQKIDAVLIQPLRRIRLPLEERTERAEITTTFDTYEPLSPYLLVWSKRERPFTEKDLADFIDTISRISARYEALLLEYKHIIEQLSRRIFLAWTTATKTMLTQADLIEQELLQLGISLVPKVSPTASIVRALGLTTSGQKLETALETVTQTIQEQIKASFAEINRLLREYYEKRGLLKKIEEEEKKHAEKGE